MDIQIITKSFTLDIYGVAGIAPNKDYAGTAFRLMDKIAARNNGVFSGGPTRTKS
jgi:hypothetical protein